MEHKFKVGDIITIIRSLTGIFKYKIVRIVENETTIKGPWVNGVDVVDISDSYIVEIIENPIIEHVGKIRMINFEMEDLYQCIPEVKSLKTNTLNSSCPRCKSLTIKKLSQDPYTGQMFNVDKCQTCGWC